MALSLIVLGASAAYAMALVLLAGAWVLALEVPLRANRTTGRLCAIYLVSQIAKYLPGNVFHFVGRHALGLRAGADHARLVRSGLIEIAGLVFAAGLLLLLSAPWRRDQALPFAGQVPIWVLATGLVGLTMGLGLGLTVWLAQRDGSRPILLFRIVTRVVPLYLGFFLCSGIILWGLAASLGFGADEPVATIGAAAGSWVIGYLTPGAPAGLGVRDAALGVLLGQMAPAGLAAVCAVAYRMATLLGDVIAWIAGAALLGWLERTASGNVGAP